MREYYVWKVEYTIDLMMGMPIPSIDHHDKMVLGDTGSLSELKEYFDSCIEGTDHVLDIISIKYIGKAEMIKDV